MQHMHTLNLPLNTHTHTHSGPHCVALYDFNAASKDELSLCAGDVIELLERVGSEWLKGRLRDQEGIFPSQFVEVKEELPVAEPPVDDSLSKALFDFEGQEGELTFKVLTPLTRYQISLGMIMRYRV